VDALRLLSLTVLFLLLVPVIAILYFGLGPMSNPLGYGTEVFRSVALSLFSAAVAAAADVLMFTPLAYYLARNRNRVTESLVDIPVSIPHPIVGIALLLLSSPVTPTGRFLVSVGVNLFNSVPGLVVALVVVSAPIYVKSLQPFFEARNPSSEQFATGLGASAWRVFRSVVLPESLRGIVSGGLIAMSRALSEFGSVAILAYYVLQSPFYGVSPESVLVYQYFSYYGLGAAVTASAMLVLVSVPLAFAVRLIGRD